MTKGKAILFYSTISIIGIYFLFLSLIKAQTFLAPFATAVILALLMIPLSRKMEKKMSRTVASLLNTFILLLISMIFMGLISFQVQNFMKDWGKIKESLQPKVEQLKDFISEHTPVKQEDLKVSSQSGSNSIINVLGNKGQKAKSFFGSVISFFGSYLLTFIYIFFLLNYRHRFKEFLLRLFPEKKKQEVKKIITESAEVVQNYLIGKLLLIGILAVLYGIGLGISGVNNFILISALAALFSLVPYIGNTLGLFMALAFGFISSDDTSILIGIVITFGIAQFVESYILEPYIVGDKVDLHPFSVILVVVIGGMVWGIIGMILAIPILAIINVVFLHIPSLRPFGYLFSKKDI